jgi:hypothetical protein
VADQWAKPAAQHRLDRVHGYGTGSPNPSVVHLNALTASAAIGEIISWVSGCRAPAGWLDIDPQGTVGTPGVQIGPRRLLPRDSSCIACSHGSYFDLKK